MEKYLELGLRTIMLIKEILALLLKLTGISFFIREVFCRNKVTIIVYHDPKAEAFRTHLDYLSKHYNFIPLESLVDALQRKDWTSIPPKGLVITFDDGHKGNYKLLEIFKDFKIIPTIYLCTHVIGTNRHFWWKEKILSAEDLKVLTNKERLDLLKKEAGFTPNREYPERQALSLKEIRQMSPYVDFQSHTKYHPILTTCTNEESLHEMSESKRYLEQLLGKECEHFSYPNGDYAAREIEYIKKIGYRSARTIDCGWIYLDSDPHRLKITGVSDNASNNLLYAQISGIIPYLKYLLLGSSKGLHPTVGIDRQDELHNI